MTTLPARDCIIWAVQTGMAPKKLSVLINAGSHHSTCTQHPLGNEMWSVSCPGARLPMSCHKVWTRRGLTDILCLPCPSGGRTPSNLVADPQFGTWLWIRIDMLLSMKLWPGGISLDPDWATLAASERFCSSRATSRDPARFLAISWPATPKEKMGRVQVLDLGRLGSNPSSTTH